MAFLDELEKQGLRIRSRNPAGDIIPDVVEVFLDREFDGSTLWFRLLGFLSDPQHRSGFNPFLAGERQINVGANREIYLFATGIPIAENEW